jgi:molybdopterin-guanine dinucleotide biosynthesis protein A
MPNITTNAIECLKKQRNNSNKIILAQSNGNLQPLFGLYPKKVLVEVEKAIESKIYKMQHFCHSVGL